MEKEDPLQKMRVQNLTSEHPKKEELGEFAEDHGRVEPALRLAQAHQRSLMETSLDPLLMIDPQGKIGDLNAALEKMTGIPREQLIGTDFTQYFTEPGRAQAACIQVLQDQAVQDWALERKP